METWWLIARIRTHHQDTKTPRIAILVRFTARWLLSFEESDKVSSRIDNHHSRELVARWLGNVHRYSMTGWKIVDQEVLSVALPCDQVATRV
jgi:hypothetical protein